MALPLLLIIGGGMAGAAGVGTIASGLSKVKKANDIMKETQKKHEKNISRFEKENKLTCVGMDKLGKFELEILYSFSTFADIFEKIKNRPIFEEYSKQDITLPKYDGENLRKVSVGAGTLLGGLGGAALGTASGFAAAGATTAAVMTFGTASTGTAIASLNGAALTNATLAALGGGSLAAGGGGMALGSTVLGATTLGVGLLIGGIIFQITGGKLSDKADEAYAQMKEIEDQINKICKYLGDLRIISTRYYGSLSAVNVVYQDHLNKFSYIVDSLGHKDWSIFTDEEKKLTENTVLLVGLLYSMCKVELVLKPNEGNVNKINVDGVESALNNARTVLENV